MRRLPLKRSPKQKLIIEMVDDFFGEGCPVEKRKLKKDIALWLMNIRRGVELNEEQKDAVCLIRNNIADWSATNGAL